jgi:hypothetical protein
LLIQARVGEFYPDVDLKATCEVQEAYLIEEAE